MNSAGEHKKMQRRLQYIAVSAACMLAAVALAVMAGRVLADDAKIPIASFEELMKIGREPDYPSDGAYMLMNDLDGVSPEGKITLTQIGSSEEPFIGSFDGQGHCIRNYQVTAEAAKPGEKELPLFITASENVINLTLEPGQPEEEAKDEIKDKAKEEEADAEEKPSEPDEVSQTTRAEEKKEAIKAKTGHKNEKEAAPDKKKKVYLSTWEQFIHIGDTSYDPAYTMDATYVLIKKIASDGKKFTPIGTKANPFCGTFDGQDYPIDLSENPEINTDGPYSGLFGIVKEPGGNE